MVVVFGRPPVVRSIRDGDEAASDRTDDGVINIVHAVPTRYRTNDKAGEHAEQSERNAPNNLPRVAVCGNRNQHRKRYANEEPK